MLANYDCKSNGNLQIHQNKYSNTSTCNSLTMIDQFYHQLCIITLNKHKTMVHMYAFTGLEYWIDKFLVFTHDTGGLSSIDFYRLRELESQQPW